MKPFIVCHLMLLCVLFCSSCSESQSQSGASGINNQDGGPMTFMELAKRRYAVRNYSDRQVSKETLVKILEAGNVAPTAMNFQPHRIRVLQKEEDLAKLDELTHCRYGASTVLLFTYDADEDWKNPLEEGVHSGVEDVSIVATHIMLQATELGVSTIWVNYFANSELEKAFGIPENEKSVLLMPVGYAAEDSKPSTSHFEKKPLEDTVLWN